NIDDGQRAKGMTDDLAAGMDGAHAMLAARRIDALDIGKDSGDALGRQVVGRMRGQTARSEEKDQTDEGENARQSACCRQARCIEDMCGTSLGGHAAMLVTGFFAALIRINSRRRL